MRHGVGRAHHHGVGTVGEVDERHRRPRGSSLGRQRLEDGRQHKQRMRGAALPDAGTQVVGQHAFAEGERLGQPGHGASVHPCQHESPEISGLEAGCLQGGAERFAAERQVPVLTEALLPQLRRALTRCTPTIGELVGRRGCAHELGQDIGSLADHYRRAGVPSRRLVTAGRQPVAHVGRHHEGRPAPPQGRHQAPHPRSQRATEVVGGHVTGSRRAAASAVAFVLSR